MKSGGSDISIFQTLVSESLKYLYDRPDISVLEIAGSVPGCRVINGTGKPGGIDGIFCHTHITMDQESTRIELINVRSKKLFHQIIAK